MELETSEKKLTPMMEQWKKCKEEAQEALLLFRLGDFYEAFYRDAEILSQELDLTLTQRQDVPMSGIPWHASEGYIDKLIAKGYKVAIAEQTEDARFAKGLVKREITRFITPGTVVNSSLLSDKANRYILALTQVGSILGLASLDMTTGEFQVMECEEEKELLNEVARLRPVEFLTSEKFFERHLSLFKEALQFSAGTITKKEAWAFEHKIAFAFLTEHFGVTHLDGFGLKGQVAGINAAGALLSYLKEDLALPISHIRSIKPFSLAEYLSLDRLTLRHLELLDSLQGDKKNSLLNVIDYTLTPMGGRLLQQWIKTPLFSVEKIQDRQDAIEAFLKDSLLHSKIQLKLEKIRDLQRLIMRIEAGYATPKDLVALGNSLSLIAPLKEDLQFLNVYRLQWCKDQLFDVSPLVHHLHKAMHDEPPLRINEGHIFKEGYHATLDELKEIAHHGKEWIARYQHILREQTGIKTLKVGFNRVFGYFIEVSRGQAKEVPENFERRQTLANSERFISPELKEYEEKVLHAEERMIALEIELFHELRKEIAAQAASIQKIALAVAEIDVLQSLAEASRRHRFIRPQVDTTTTLHIEGGRHPLVERALPMGTFIPNDFYLDGQKERLMLITGPNMGGKSTYLRQTALIVILAQMGSFVPAQKAQVGLVDKIFTRIGASDDLSRGQSTFMVEMSETANILHNATSSSLVLLDEIGRGTSTYDGVSIAWAVTEALALSENCHPKTLFATHYGELTQLEKTYPVILNFHAAVHEAKGEIVFAHKILRGAADRSYGIHVAKLAGLPFSVITRAQQILHSLEQGNSSREKGKKIEKKETQLNFL